MTEILKMDKITKIYPGGVVANYQVDFDLREGEIHALIGENGAGKSTLMKILFGIEKPTEGKIFVRGKEEDINSPHDALALKIGMVHQHFMLVPSLSVAENIILGSEIKKGIFLDREKAIKVTGELSQKYNLPVDPKSRVMDISVSKKQKVEILKALYRGAEILVLDEPTAVLTPQEIQELFRELTILKEQGYTIVFISHKLQEIKQLCDRLTILRDGRSQGVYNVSEVTEEQISKLMVGRSVTLEIEKKPSDPKETLLKVEDINYINDFGKHVVKNVSFTVRKGEIVGLAGVEGNGQSEVVEIITGMSKAQKGKVFVNDKEISKLNIKEIRDLGLSHIPEDRIHTGIAPDMSVKENLVSEMYRDPSLAKNKILLHNKKITDFTDKIINDYSIKVDNPNSQIKGLSGGNIQKVVVGREFAIGADVLIINQPTRGIDVGTIEFIRKRIIEMRDEGHAILLVSADLNEIMTLSDSLAVMHEGEIVGYFQDASTVTQEELGFFMLGVKRHNQEEIGRAVNE